MCVIIVKNKEGKLPSKESLKNCFKRNSDGAGFMYANNKNELVIDKGYMDFDSFYNRYEKLCEKFNDFKGKNLVMHMRISTAGGVKQENTHPFEITNNMKNMKLLHNKCEIGLAHNGVISIAQPTKTQEVNGINDTMIFIKAYLNPIYEQWKECFENESFTEGINLLTNSKFAILDKNDKLTLIGDFQEYEGTLYSNPSYMYYNYYKNYNYNQYYDDYDYDYDFNYVYDKKDKEDIEDIDFEDKDGIFYTLEDDEVVSISDEMPEISIKDLRTEKDSVFYYNDITYTLEEVSKEGKTLEIYLNAFLLY